MVAESHSGVSMFILTAALVMYCLVTRPLVTHRLIRKEEKHHMEFIERDRSTSERVEECGAQSALASAAVAGVNGLLVKAGC